MALPNIPANRLALRPREMARALGVSQRTLFEWARRRGLPHTKIGRAVLFLPAQVEQWLAEQAQGAQPAGEPAP